MEHLGYLLSVWIFIGVWMSNHRRQREIARTKLENVKLARTLRQVSNAMVTGVVLRNDWEILITVAEELEERKLK